MTSLRDHLDHPPVPLRFGTSGRRGRVADLTQLEIYLNVRAELEHLIAQPVEAGGIRPGQEFFVAHDLRPSSTRFVPEQGGRGELVQAVLRAVADAGFHPVYLGPLPTPALTACGLAHRSGSIMVTGSHIPFDRNGYKTNSARGELRKSDESPIDSRAAAWRERLHAEPFDRSPFDASGRFKTGSSPLPAPADLGRRLFLDRYLDFFRDHSLRGLRLLLFEHSAVGRDLLRDLLERLGARVLSAGRTDTFLPVDTENVDAPLLAQIEALVDDATARFGPLDAVVSTDGDSDRPLLLSVDPTPEGPRLRFHSGDLLGMVVAQYLDADAVVVPVTCNDGLERGPLKDRIQPRTRIGSPFVIAGMAQARQRGRQRVCGWEANGGFLLGSDLERAGRVLAALPTRDAFLPLLGTLFAAVEQGRSLASLFEALPPRFSRATLLREFPRAVSQAILERFAPPRPGVVHVRFTPGGLLLADSEGRSLPAQEADIAWAHHRQAELEQVFSPNDGFGRLIHLDYTDGLRCGFSDGDIAHVRPSGNADELRLYAVADQPERAEAIARLAVREPDGLLRRLELLADLQEPT